MVPGPLTISKTTFRIPFVKNLLIIQIHLIIGKSKGGKKQTMKYFIFYGYMKFKKYIFKTLLNC